MPTNYSGNAAGITSASAVQITVPQSGDTETASSVTTATNKLTDFMKYLFTEAALLGAADGGTSHTNTGPDNGTALTLFASAGGTGNANALNAKSAGTGYAVQALTPNGASGSAIKATTGSGTAEALTLDASAGTGRAVHATAGASVSGLFENNDVTAAVHGHNSGAGPGVRGQAAAATDVAIDASVGLIGFSGGSTLAATAALLNKLTATSIIKGWAYIVTNGATGITLVDGQNVASVALNAGGGFGHTIIVNWAQAFASNLYGVGHFNAPTIANVPVNLLTSNQGQAAGNVKIGFWDTGANAPVDPNGTAVGLFVVALGAQ